MSGCCFIFLLSQLLLDGFTLLKVLLDVPVTSEALKGFRGQFFDVHMFFKVAKIIVFSQKHLMSLVFYKKQVQLNMHKSKLV